MDRLRRSLRDSFRKRKDSIPECSRPHQWQSDENSVRLGTCNFSVKYLGCVEVFESRGMQVCEEALKVLRNSRKRPVKGTLYVTGDGLRVVDDETKGLLVDQTIEKVSFCAPDRNHEKGFSYICRDGTTRRWMCHGFLSLKDSGERLSHAVGCAFAVCLEKKQKRDKEAIVLSFDPVTSTFTRTGSFKQSSLTERLQDPQDCKPTEPPPIKPVKNPYAIERPHAPPILMQRQGSFRGFTTLNQASPFKRQLSLRLDELPSTLERQKAMSMDYSQSCKPIHNSSTGDFTGNEKTDSISAMCQQLSKGLTFLTTNDGPLVTSAPSNKPVGSQDLIVGGTRSWPENENSRAEAWLNDSAKTVQQKTTSERSNVVPSSTNNAEHRLPTSLGTNLPSVQPHVPPRRSSPNFSHLRCQSLGSGDATFFSSLHSTTMASEWPQTSVLSNRQTVTSQVHGLWINGNAMHSVPNNTNDPFDAEWVSLATRHQPPTNPFVLQHSVKAFEVQM